MNQNKAYYSHFNTELLLGAKELLKSMPALYTNIYFSSKYLNSLLNGDVDEEFVNVTILTEMENALMLRNIIKTNFLYIAEWDSINFTEGDEFGFSFIAGNIKYILLPFIETDSGYVVRSYDVDTGDCYETTLNIDKQYFKNVAIKENGDFIKTADFNLEYINPNNTTTFKAAKKDRPELIVVDDNKGYALTNMYIIFITAILGIFVVWLASFIMKSMIVG